MEEKNEVGGKEEEAPLDQVTPVDTEEPSEPEATIKPVLSPITSSRPVVIPPVEAKSFDAWLPGDINIRGDGYTQPVAVAVIVRRCRLVEGRVEYYNGPGSVKRIDIPDVGAMKGQTVADAIAALGRYAIDRADIE